MSGSKGYRKGNRVVVREDHATLYDTEGNEILIDTEDLQKVLQYTWYAISHDGRTFARTSSPDEMIYLHRFVLEVQPGELVGFWNGNSLDCRKSNLRVLTAAQTQSRKPATSRSGYKGVYPHYGRWRALISINGRKRHLGTFDTPEEAARAYNQAALEVFGDYTFLNKIPNEVPQERSTRPGGTLKKRRNGARAPEGTG